MTNEWIEVHENTPRDTDLLLWLKADQGLESPIGAVVGRFTVTEFFEGFCEKSTVASGINLGLRRDLVTHYKLIGEGPEDDGGI
jgi:hypothetical protein